MLKKFVLFFSTLECDRKDKKAFAKARARKEGAE